MPGFLCERQVLCVKRNLLALVLAGAMLVLCVVAAIVMPRGGETSKSAIEQQVNEAQAPVNAIPTFPGVTNGEGSADAPAATEPEGTASATEE